MAPLHNITILGGGLTGLTTAYRLSRVLAALPPLPTSAHEQHKGAHRDTKVTLLEKSNRIGGWVHSSAWIVKVPQKGEAERKEVEIMLEAGPRSIRPKGSIGAAYMLKLIQDLSLEEHILSVPLDHPSARNRFILSRATNRLVRLPSGLGDILGLTSRGSTITTAEGTRVPGTDTNEEKRLRKILRRGILTDLFRSRTAASAAPQTDTGARDTTIHSLVSRTLGPSVANTLISAMVHGIYAADSRMLSVRSTFPILWDAMFSGNKKTGSLVWNLVSSGLFGKRNQKTEEEERKAAEEAAAWASLGPLDAERKKWSVYGLKSGLGVLTDKMEHEARMAGVTFVRECEVGDVRVADQGKVTLSMSTASQPSKTHETDLIISTLNPSTLDPLIALNQRLPHLSANPSTTVGLVNIVYPLPSQQIHPDGFGYLIPRAPEDDGLPPSTPGQSSIPNASGILGVVFDSSTLPSDPTPDAAKHVTKLTIMLGGPHWRTESDIPTDPQSLIALAQDHLKQVFPVLQTVEPVIVKSWIQRQCIPTYLPGHGARLRELHELLSDEEGKSPWAGKLAVAGSGYGGVGVNDCVGSAEGVVRALERKWKGAGEAGKGVTGLERWEKRE